MQGIGNGPAAGGIIARAKAIVTSPTTEWARIAGETDAPMQVFTRYAVPLAAIGPVAQFVGGQVFGYGALGIRYSPSFTSGLTAAILTYLLSLASLWVVALVASKLAPRFGGREDFPAGFRLVAYAMTASWLSGIFGLVPALSILGLLGLYSLYLLYKGAAPVMGVPADKAVGFMVVTVLVAIAINIIVGLMAAGIAGTGAMV